MSSSPYREEATWSIRIEAGASFDDAYDGELDGYVWRETQFRDIQRRVLALVMRELAATPGWRVHAGNRGLAATDEVMLHLELDADSEAFAPRSS
jgi:hypothetical protein